MGNCQAVDAAALVIQHPNGKLERMYWPIIANEVMKMNPGHYVSLIIPLPASGDDGRTVRFTRVKLLRPSDTLVLGRAYRLVTTQEVMKVLRAKKHAKMKRHQSDSGENMLMDSTGSEILPENSELENNIDLQKVRQNDMKPDSGQKIGQTTPAEGGEFHHRTAQIVAAIFAKHFRVCELIMIGD